MDFDIFVIFGETFAKKEGIYVKMFHDLVSGFVRSSLIFKRWSKMFDFFWKKICRMEKWCNFAAVNRVVLRMTFHLKVVNKQTV